MKVYFWMNVVWKMPCTICTKASMSSFAPFKALSVFESVVSCQRFTFANRQFCRSQKLTIVVTSALILVRHAHPQQTCSLTWYNTNDLNFPPFSSFCGSIWQNESAAGVQHSWCTCCTPVCVDGVLTTCPAEAALSCASCSLWSCHNFCL